MALEALRVADVKDQIKPESANPTPTVGNNPARASSPATTTAATPESGREATTSPAPAPEPGKTQPGTLTNLPESPREDQRTPIATIEPRRSPFEEQITRAIREGVRFLKGQQRIDGSWPDIELDAKTGTTSLVTLALLTAGEPTDSPSIRKALSELRSHSANQLNNTYAISLQTLVFAAAAASEDRTRIAANVAWLVRAQIGPADQVPWPGSWTYAARRGRPGDNSNSQYALMALNAAQETGIDVRPQVWSLAHSYWESGQRQDGSWAYTPRTDTTPTASNTCAGISGLILSRRWASPARGQEVLKGRTVRDCGKARIDRDIQGGIDWLSDHFDVGQNIGGAKNWRFYYLYGLERASRLAGVRFIGQNDWFRLGSESLIRDQDKLSGFWRGELLEADKTLATTFAILFLAKGRAPVLINKLNHAPASDWNNDHDDVANLVDLVSRERKSLLTWQIVNSRSATVVDLLRAPILFLNGHKAPEFTPREKETLKAYIKRGGTIFAEACCDHSEFDRGFRELMTSMFPESELRLLPEDHAIWRAKHLLGNGVHPLWGIALGERTTVIYSPKDLSCYWNQAKHDPANSMVIRAIKVGQNVVEYVAGIKRPTPTP